MHGPVEEVTSAVESVAGLEASEQSVLFRGKVLSPSDVLREVGRWSYLEHLHC